MVLANMSEACACETGTREVSARVRVNSNMTMHMRREGRRP